jgi:hypothetical protein
LITAIIIIIIIIIMATRKEVIPMPKQNGIEKSRER